jgi:hypothetical protein
MDPLEQVARVQSDDGRSAEDLIAGYRGGAKSLREAVAGLDGEALRARPIEGKLSTLEVLTHLADCEQFLADRMKRTIALERPLLVGIDPTAYPERLRYQERDPELALRLIELTREQMASDLGRLEPADWERQGVHTETGLVTLRQQVLHTTRHLEWHLETIREKRAALGM